MLHLPLLALLVSAQGATADKPRIIVLELESAGGADVEVAAALSEAVTNHVASTGYFQVTGAREVQTLISVERQKQLAGCSDENANCFAELAGALGARFVLRGTLAKLGDSWQLTLQMLDSEVGKTLGRSTRLASSLEALRAVLPWAVADATGTPPPPRPSNVASYSLILAGALAVAGGGVVGYQALSQEERIAAELEVGRSQTDVLRPASFYRDEAQRLTLEKNISVGVVGGGAALLALGALLYQRDPVSDASGSSVALTPTHSGFALVGVWP